MVALTKYLQNRYESYETLVNVVHHIIANTNKAALSLLNNPNFVSARPKPQSTCLYRLPFFLAIPTDGKRPTLKVTEHMASKYLQDKPAYLWGLLSLLRCHAVAKATDNEGVTWLEIFFTRCSSHTITCNLAMASYINPTTEHW